MRDTFKLLLIGDSDSQLLACEALCQFPAQLNVAVTINAIPRDGTPESILQRAAALGELWRLDFGRLLTEPRLRDFDAIGVFLTGSKISDFRLALGLLPIRERPLLFCGFNGVVLQKFMEGISWRLGYDLIGLSGQRDRDALESMLAGTPFANQRTVLTGMRSQLQAPEDVCPHEQRQRRLVLPSRS